jgi:hypothetical protein
MPSKTHLFICSLHEHVMLIHTDIHFRMIVTAHSPDDVSAFTSSAHIQIKRSTVKDHGPFVTWVLRTYTVDPL